MNKYFALLYSNILGIVFAFLMVYIAYNIHALPFPPFTINGFHIFDKVLIVLLLGMLMGNLFPIRLCNQGINFASKYILQLGIILLGAKLNFHHLVEISSKNILIIIVAVMLSFLITYLVCWKFKIDKQISILLAFGISICGAAAIAVIGGITKTSKINIATSIAAITLMGSIAMFSYPLLGKIMHLSSEDFGMLAGTTVHSVPQTISTGMLFSPVAGERATIIKLVRVLLLLPTILIYMSYSYRKNQGNNLNILRKIFIFVPPFIIGFIMISALNSLDLFNFTVMKYNIAKAMADIASFCILVALFSIGYNTKVIELMSLSKKILIVTFISSFILFASVATLLIIF